MTSLHELKRASTATYEIFLDCLQNAKGDPPQLLRDLQNQLDGISSAAVWVSDEHDDIEILRGYNDNLIRRFNDMIGGAT